ncbi:IPT/TIG domain-containing protein [Streptomyces decoyicus]|uniref:IPT/TIG domain-containing protein n=1 Tax=Streptomyces decoyicus TaxID=249567 RepID=UPI0033B2E18C
MRHAPLAPLGPAAGQREHRRLKHCLSGSAAKTADPDSEPWANSAGGDPVLIVGTELAPTQSVTIGGVAADFGVISNTRIAAVTPPAAAPGPANVTVTTTGGTATAPGAFIYT